MLKPSSKLINIKMLVGDLEFKRNNDATSIALMSYSDVNNTELMPELSKLLKTIFNLQECGFFWSDAAGNFLDAWCTAPQFLKFDTLVSCAQFQASHNRAWPTFTENVLVGPICGYLLPFQNERFYASEHYASVYEPMGVKHLLDLVIHDGTRPHGSFLMMRNAKQGSFTPDERNFLSKLIPTINAAFLKKDTNLPTLQSDYYHTGFAVISAQGELRMMDAKAAGITWALAFDKPGAFANPATPKLTAHLSQIFAPYLKSAIKGETPSWVVKNRWGQFNMQFELMYESTDFVLKLSKNTPMHTLLIAKLHQYKLPPMRQMVAWLLLLNNSRQQIADALGITLETAISHIKTLYRETDTQSSHGLLLKLMG